MEIFDCLTEMLFHASQLYQLTWHIDNAYTHSDKDYMERLDLACEGARVEQAILAFRERVVKTLAATRI